MDMGKGVNVKEEELLSLVASLIVEIILKNENHECDRVHSNQREGSVDVLPSIPGESDKGLLRTQ